MPYPKISLPLLLTAIIGLIAGCTTTPPLHTVDLPIEESGESVEIAAEDSINGQIPAVELSPDLLYQLLVADFASQAGGQRLASEQYLRAAVETRDPRLAKRATRLAMYGNETSLALKAATLWGDLAPGDIEATQAMASIFIDAGRLTEARPHLDKIIAAPMMKREHGYIVVANMLGRAADKQQALTVMEELIAGEKNQPAALYAYASLAAEQESGATALQSIEQLLAIQPNHLQGLILKARLLHVAGRLGEASATLSKAVKHSPENFKLRMIYARMLIDERRLDEAEQQFAILNSQSPDNPDVLYGLGLLALQKNELDVSERYLLRLIELEQREAEANFALGQIAESRKEIDKAIGYYEAVESGENMLDARLRAALLIANRDGLGTARDYLHAINPDNANDTIRIALFEGELLREAKRYTEAMSVYDDNLALFPDSTELLYARAMMAERIDRLDILEQDLRTIIKQEPDHAQALNALGYTLADRTTRYKEAYQLVSRAHQLSSNDPAILDSMGWVLYRLGRHQEALGYLKQAMNLSPDPEIAAHLGEVLWTLGEQKEARKIWDDALRRWPGHPVLKETVERFAK